jgi:uncharacterized protein (DUF2147 family)
MTNHLGATLVTLLLMLAQALSQAGDPPRWPPEVSALVDQARALPAEFHADTLIRLAGSTLVRRAPWKQELIEEAYWAGSHSSLPYLQRADGRSDSVAANAVRANGLEALTLQTKAVQEMISLNPGIALRLFEQIPPVRLPKLACSNAFTPDVVAYYQTGMLIFQDAFTSKQRAHGDDLIFLRQVVGSVESPAQVSASLEMAFSVNLTADDRRELLSLLAAELQLISRSDREYGAAEASLVSAINADRVGSSEAAVLLPALRSYIVRHVSGRRCTDNISASGRMAKSAEQFNSLAAKLDPTESRYKRISVEEAQATGDDGTYQKSLSGQSAQSKEVTEALRWLTHGNRVRDGKVLRWTLEERSSQQWLGHYADAAKLVHDLKEDDEPSPEAFFCMKADALNLLATLAPPSPMRDKAMEEYIDFLENYSPSIQNVNLWFTMFRHMLYTARFSDDPRDKSWILSELARSSDPIISLYAKLEARTGPPVETSPAVPSKSQNR